VGYSITRQGSVRRVWLVVIFFIITPIIAIRVRDDDDLAEDLIKLVSACLLVSSPLDKDIKAERLDSPPGVHICGFTQQLVVSSMGMPDVRKNGKLDPAREGDIRCKPDQRVAFALVGLVERNLRFLFELLCSGVVGQRQYQLTLLNEC